MKRFGGSIALTCGILGIFAPFIDAFFALARTQDRLTIEANPFSLGFGALIFVIVMALAGFILNRQHRAFAIALMIFCFIANVPVFGVIGKTLLWCAFAGGALSLFERRKQYSGTPPKFT